MSQPIVDSYFEHAGRGAAVVSADAPPPRTYDTSTLLRASASARLWLEVLRTAMDDVREGDATAVVWFRSDATTPGSVCWIADHLRLDVKVLRKRLSL